MYRVQEELTVIVKVCTVYSVKGDIKGQYRYVRVQEEITVKVCTVYSVRGDMTRQ